MSNQWHPEGGRGGLPSDMLTSFKVGQRRLKTSSRSELAEIVEDGFAYSFTGSYTSSPDEIISVNLDFASDTFLRRVTCNPGFKIEIFDQDSTGSPDGLLSPHNLNQSSVDESPASAQIFYNSLNSGNRLELGYSEVDPFIFSGNGDELAIAITNTSAQSQDVDFVIIFEEVGEREPSLGLTPSTFLQPDTEMSIYG